MILISAAPLCMHCEQDSLSHLQVQILDSQATKVDRYMPESGAQHLCSFLSPMLLQGLLLPCLLCSR
jgi:hypothetical protein